MARAHPFLAWHEVRTVGRTSRVQSEIKMILVFKLGQISSDFSKIFTAASFFFFFGKMETDYHFLICNFSKETFFFLFNADFYYLLLLPVPLHKFPICY